METLTKIAWFALAAIHTPPALVVAAPNLIQRLYDVEPHGDVGVLLSHRGALFAAITAACIMGAMEPAARRALGLVVAISVIGFLFLYFRAGAPAGPLRTIMIADLIALAPLAWIVAQAWRAHAA